MSMKMIKKIKLNDSFLDPEKNIFFNVYYKT